MAQPSSATAQETKLEKASKTERIGRRLSKFVPWREKHDTTMPAEAILHQGLGPSAEEQTAARPDGESQDVERAQTTRGTMSTQSRENGSPGSGTSILHQGPDSSAENKPVAPPGEESQDGETAQTTRGTMSTQPRENGSVTKMISSPVKVRDLWAVAWASHELDGDIRERLLEPWRRSFEDDQNSLKLPDRDENAKERSKSAQSALKVENTARDVQYGSRLDDLIKGLRVTQVQYADEWGKPYKDTAEKIVTSVLTVKKIVDTAVSFDPTGYGAGVWSVVSFGLTVGSCSTIRFSNSDWFSIVDPNQHCAEK